MQVWNLLQAARWKYRTQKIAKIRRLRTIVQICWAISSHVRHVLTIGKNLLSSNISSTCRHNGELRPTSGWDIGRFASLRSPANFNGFRVLASLLHRSRSTEVNQTLHDVWPSPWLVHYIYIFEGFCPLTELYQVQYSFCIQVYRVLLYWLRYCSALEQWASAKLFGVVSSGDRATSPFDIGRSNCLISSK